MLRWVGEWALRLAGVALLLICIVFGLAIPSAAFKESHPLLATFGMLCLFCFTTGTIGFYMVDWAARLSVSSPALSQRVARILVMVAVLVAFYAICRATTPRVYIPLVLLMIWFSGSYYYLRYLDGWSTLPARVRQRLTNTLGFWVYGVLHVMALVLINLVWLIITAGRGGLVGFGGGRSGGAGASQKW